MMRIRSIVLLLLCAIGNLQAGSNAHARLVLDFDPTDLSQVETVGYADTESRIRVAVIAQGVTNLDTVSFDIQFEPAEIAFEGAEADLPGVSGHILESAGGTLVGFFARHDQSALNVSMTLAGKDTAQAPEGSGLLAVLTFQITGGVGGIVQPRDVIFVDSLGVEDVVTRLSGGSARRLKPIFYRGDPNNTGTADLMDAIAILMYLFRGAGEPVCLEAGDIDNSGRINVSDPIWLLYYLFKRGAPPAPPGPPSIGEPCGPDPDPPGTPADLGCQTYTNC